MSDTVSFEKAPINWLTTVFLLGTLVLAVTAVPWYLWRYGVGAPVWFAFLFFMAWTGLGVTAGYHRLLAHRSYEAHPFVKYFLLLGATLAVESSAYDWCSGHRQHHRYVDDENKDPYSARRGFWFSHIGWMLKRYPSGNYDYKNIPDLKKDKILQWQHDHYGVAALASNALLVGGLGLILGDFWGTLLVVGALRLVLTHHFTFFINSLCHMFGTRPYTDENTARDNPILALFTWGEGYHNYHHYFQYDYRNGVKWWQYDPTKWLIALLHKMGLASDLKRADDLTVRHAELTMRFRRAQARIAAQQDRQSALDERWLRFKESVAAEYEAFCKTAEEWQQLKSEAVRLKKAEFNEHLNDAEQKLKDGFAQIERKIAAHAKALESAVAQRKKQNA